MSQYKKKSFKREPFVNFKNLNNSELIKLRDTWEKDAYIFELRLNKYHSNPNPHPDKLKKLWNNANNLWNKVRILERWIQKNLNSRTERSA